MIRNLLGSLVLLTVSIATLSSCSTIRTPGIGSSARGLGAGWSATFPVPYQPVGLASTGRYTGGSVQVNFDSISPALMEPTPTGAWKVLPFTPEPRKQHVTFQDPVEGLRAKTDASSPNFYDRRPGAISAEAWVDQKFDDVRVSVVTNTSGGPNGMGAKSRQGPMARWDKGSNWVWCSLNYTTGEYSIVRARVMGVYESLAGSTGKLTGFNSKVRHQVVLEVIGNTARCQILSMDGKLMVDTGKIIDPTPTTSGVSGYLAEVAMESYQQPLEGSFMDLSSYAVTP